MRDYVLTGSSERLCRSFREFVGKYDGHGVHPEDPLIRYLELWLVQGDAVIEADGDFSGFLKGVLYIIARSQGGNNFNLDFKGMPGKKPIKRRTLLIVIQPEDIDQSPVFDPSYFKAVFLRRTSSGSSA